MDKGFYGYQGNSKALGPALTGIIITDQLEGGDHRVESETLIANIYNVRDQTLENKSKPPSHCIFSKSMHFLVKFHLVHYP